MKMSPCKDCPDRHLACHDECDKYKEWKAYVDDTRRKQKQDHFSYRSSKTNKEMKRTRKRESGSFMKDKY